MRRRQRCTRVERQRRSGAGRTAPGWGRSTTSFRSRCTIAHRTGAFVHLDALDERESQLRNGARDPRASARADPAPEPPRVRISRVPRRSLRAWRRRRFLRRDRGRRTAHGRALASAEGRLPPAEVKNALPEHRGGGGVVFVGARRVCEQVAIARVVEDLQRGPGEADRISDRVDPLLPAERIADSTGGCNVLGLPASAPALPAPASSRALARCSSSKGSRRSRCAPSPGAST